MKLSEVKDIQNIVIGPKLIVKSGNYYVYLENYTSIALYKRPKDFKPGRSGNVYHAYDLK